MKSNNITTEFKEQILYRINESLRMVTLSLEKIEETDLWSRPNKNANSIGNLLLHLCGNIHQYVISSLGNKPDIRQRDSEFEAVNAYNKSELLNKLNTIVNLAKQTITEASQEELLKKRYVQGYHFSGIAIIIHVTEHFSYHTGQIAFWVKQITNNKSLGFYDGIDLNTKNEI